MPVALPVSLLLDVAATAAPIGDRWPASVAFEVSRGALRVGAASRERLMLVETATEPGETATCAVSAESVRGFALAARRARVATVRVAVTAEGVTLGAGDVATELPAIRPAPPVFETARRAVPEGVGGRGVRVAAAGLAAALGVRARRGEVRVAMLDGRPLVLHRDQGSIRITTLIEPATDPAC